MTLACGAPPTDPAEPATQIARALTAGSPLRLVPADNALFDQFGFQVATNGTSLFVSAPSKDPPTGSGEGVVYVFERVNSEWVVRQTLAAARMTEDDTNFGLDIATDGALLVASNPFRGFEPGLVEVFRDTGETWQREVELGEPSEPAGMTFGWSLSVSGDSVLVATLAGPNSTLPGAAYVFVHDGQAWQPQAELSVPGIAFQDSFGSTAYLHGDDAFVGTALPETSSGDRLYWFERAGDMWTERQELQAANGSGRDYFGSAMVELGNELFVGAMWSDELERDAGAVYVFEKRKSGWAQTQVLVPWNEPEEGDKPHWGEFGRSLAIENDTLLVGAAQENAAYVFQRASTGSWEPALKLRSRSATGAFGWSVALASGTAFIGVPAESDVDAGRINNGAVFVYSFGAEDGAPCSTDQDCANRRCVVNTCGEGAGGAGGEAGRAGEAGAAATANAGVSGSSSAPPAPDAPGGCTCRVAPSRSGGAWVWAVTLAALVARRRRRT